MRRYASQNLPENNVLGNTSRLARLIDELTGESGIYSTEIAGLWLARFSVPNPPRHAINSAVFCAVAQGSISVLMPGEIYTHGPDRYLVMALAIPAIAQLVGVTPKEPYLGVTLELDFNELSELSLSDVPPTAATQGAGKALFFGEFDAPLIDAVYRLVGLLTTPKDIPVLAPLVRREIFYRLLSSNPSGLLRKLVMKNAQIRHLARTVDWMKKNYAKTFKVEDLARRSNMSVASLHSWFKAVTTLSPLQFHKRLRLQEARRMLYLDGEPATTVSRRVGYESPSHFNRDYSRLFGAPPLRDMERMRSVSGGVNGIPERCLLGATTYRPIPTRKNPDIPSLNGAKPPKTPQSLLTSCSLSPVRTTR